MTDVCDYRAHAGCKMFSKNVCKMFPSYLGLELSGLALLDGGVQLLLAVEEPGALVREGDVLVQRLAPNPRAPAGPQHESEILRSIPDAGGAPIRKMLF